MQSVMLSLSGKIEAMAELSHVLLMQKEKAVRKKESNNALFLTKNVVNHFLQSCSKFLEFLLCRKSLV